MLKTAEAVTPKHPDKICDRISDAVLDACLSQDPYSRVAIEAMGGHGMVNVIGELTSTAKLDVPAIVERIVGPGHKITVNISQQSPEIGRGVDVGGAGDQGIMVGYASSSNPSLLPLEAYLAKDLCRFIFAHHPNDGKTQVTTKDEKIFSVVASFQKAKARELLVLIQDWLKDKNIANEITFHLNPAGDWDLGGFDADTGLTGRKIVCDNYGPQVPVGGGAFSGKDATKVDRSAALMARKVAVDLLKERGADEVIVKLAYAIGRAQPVMAVYSLTTKGQTETGEVDPKKYDLTPKGIINFLDLRRPQFERVAEWGSFGNNFFWDN